MVVGALRAAENDGAGMVAQRVRQRIAQPRPPDVDRNAVPAEVLADAPRVRQFLVQHEQDRFDRSGILGVERRVHDSFKIARCDGLGKSRGPRVRYDRLAALGRKRWAWLRITRWTMRARGAKRGSWLTIQFGQPGTTSRRPPMRPR